MDVKQANHPTVNKTYSTIKVVDAPSIPNDKDRIRYLGIVEMLQICYNLIGKENHHIKDKLKTIIDREVESNDDLSFITSSACGTVSILITVS